MNNQYFKMYFKESDKIQEFGYFEEKEINGDDHFFEFNYTKEDILKIILNLPEDLKKKIRDIFIQIDFKNGDINHFLDYLLTGHCKEHIRQQINNIKENHKNYL